MIVCADGDPAALAKPVRGLKSTAADVEFHIEQCRALEAANVLIGVVSSIVGIRRLTIAVTGRADHAGTTPMNERRDALVGAAKVVGAVYDLAVLSAYAATLSLAVPTDCAPLVRHAIAKAAHGFDLGVLSLPSGAGHDAVNAALIGPTGMIFIPCLDGRSHCPEEWTMSGGLFDDARVLAKTLRELDRTL